MSDTQVRLSWTNVLGETGYVLERSADGQSGWSTINSPLANVITYTNTALTADTDSFYRVTARNASGDSPASEVKSAHTLLPTVTGTAAAAPSTTEIDLTWDESTGESSYQVERSTNGTTFTLLATVDADTHAYANTGLVAGTTYYYRVRAVNAGGPSPAPAKTTITTRPPGTTASATTVSASQLRVAWTNVAGETGYRVERSADGQSDWSTIATTAANVLSYVNSGLSADAVWYYRVTPFNASGDGQTSSVVSRRTLLAAPTGVTAQAASATSVTVNWTDQDGATSYKVERLIGTAWTVVGTTDADTTTFTNTGLLASRIYSFRIRAVNEGGVSANSTPASATTPAASRRA
jgi:titin